MQKTRRETLTVSNKRRVPLDATESLSLGTRVHVYWTGDGAWYAGKIVSFDERGCWIVYDDGERKVHDLADPREVWELEDTCPPKKAAPMPPPLNAETTSAFDAAVSGLSGKRKVVPTQVKIGNQYVKRQNLYDMDTGENSAFKLDDAYDDAFEPQERKTHAAPPPPAATKSSGRSQQQPRLQSEAERRRLATNEALRRDAAAMAQRRARFFHEHRARIEPFCEPKVLASLAEAAAAAPPAPPQRALLSQPDSVVGGEMRDYQLTGLDWMVDCCERHGLMPILGDEMARPAPALPVPPSARARAHLPLNARSVPSARVPPSTAGPREDAADHRSHRTPGARAQAARRRARHLPALGVLDVVRRAQAVGTLLARGQAPLVRPHRARAATLARARGGG